MYKTTVPFELDEVFCEKTALSLVRKMKADRVFLATGKWQKYYMAGTGKQFLEKIRMHELIKFFQSEGLEVGVWLAGTILRLDMKKEEMPARSVVDASGKEIEFLNCPLDPVFFNRLAEVSADVAKFEPSLIMYDDDFRINDWGPEIACFCEEHMKKYRKLLGEDITREEFVSKVFSGGANRYRDVWMSVNGTAFENIAREVRAAVDAVNPTIRIGLCAMTPIWDCDGSDCIRLGKLFAGNTKPFLRLVGPPYWYVQGTGYSTGQLSSAIEMERMQASWCVEAGVREQFELFTEDDSWPHSRYFTPSSHVECFDQILRATNEFDGVQKYAVCYGDILYDESCVDLAARNLPLYNAIDQLFAQKKPVGVRVYRYMHTLAGAVLPEGFQADKPFPYHNFPPYGATFLAQNSIPTTYDGEYAGICVGEDARYLPEDALERGLILDSDAAQILTQRGIDVGAEHFSPILQDAHPRALADSLSEFFIEEGQTFKHFLDKPELCEISVKQGAEVLSEFVYGRRFPASYRYENASGQRFFVLAFPFLRSSWCHFLTRCYYRQRQLARHLEWLAKKPLPAFCPGNPDLYVLCSQNEQGLTVGLWNLSDDTVFDAKVQLSREYSNIAMAVGEGYLKGNCLILSKDIPPYGFAGFLLEK